MVKRKSVSLFFCHTTYSIAQIKQCSSYAINFQIWASHSAYLSFAQWRTIRSSVKTLSSICTTTPPEKMLMAQTSDLKLILTPWALSSIWGLQTCNDWKCSISNFRQKGEWCLFERASSSYQGPMIQTLTNKRSDCISLCSEIQNRTLKKLYICIINTDKKLHNIKGNNTMRVLRFLQWQQQFFYNLLILKDWGNMFLGNIDLITPRHSIMSQKNQNLIIKLWYFITNIQEWIRIIDLKHITVNLHMAWVFIKDEFYHTSHSDKYQWIYSCKYWKISFVTVNYFVKTMCIF